MPYGIFLQSELTDMATAINTSEVGPIYLYKDSNGAISSSVSEHPFTTSFGYPFQFINGDVIMTALTISNLNQIPWSFPYTTLTASNSNLWNSSLMMWIDAFELKSISAPLQKIVSKDYTNNISIVENTTNYSFSYASPSLSLTNNSSLETASVQSVYSYFKLGMVFTLPTQTLNTVLFQHNRLKIKLSSQTAPDGSTQSMIGIFDNDVFKRGITLKPSDLIFKYQLYTDNLGNLTISGNTSAYGGNPTYYQATTAKIYVGSDSTKNYPANMILHELLLYESVADDIVATSANISTYFTARHSLSTYADIYNIAPATWTNVYSRGNRMSIITVNTNFAISSGNGGTIQNWVDGSVSGGANQYKFYYTAGQSVSGKYMGFALATPQKISGFKIIGGTDTPKTFDFQGSTNNSTWVSLGTFIYMDASTSVNINGGETVPDTDYVSDGSATVSTILISNATAYQYYRMYGVSGTTSGGPYELEILFKVAS